jgi:DNA-binding NtrC family response regulator
MLTAHTTVQDAVDAMKLEACDFIINTVDLQGLDQAVDRGPSPWHTLRKRILYDIERGAGTGLRRLMVERAAVRLWFRRAERGESRRDVRLRG